MFQAVTERFAKQDIVIKAAAVSDYTPMDILEHKLKQEGGLSVQFKRTKDILKYLGEKIKRTNILLVLLLKHKILNSML